MKILAVSDLHCHDYPQRNPSERFRLYQTRTVAQNIIEVGKQEGADIIVLAGDILEKSVVRPYIQGEVKLFLDTVMANFKEGYIIWGNHDEDNRDQEQYFTDACLSVMLPGNLHYADGQIVQVGSSLVGFSNWKPVFDLSWIPGKLDVLFTHATISYSPGSDRYQSQPLDESKFDLAICGDIHSAQTIGKYVSIGIPQRCKMGDSEEQTGVIYDTEDKTWKWVNLNPHDNLLKFQYTPIQEQEGYDAPSNTWLVYKPDNVTRTAGYSEIKVPAWEEVGNLIDDIIEANGLGVVHSEVLKNCKDIEAYEVDFDFRLTRFYCKNWRSIEELELFFGEADKILIRGKNGSGKSSLLSAIKYAFTENRFLKDFIQFDQKECVTEIEFMYQGKLCRIQRGSKKYGLTVDGEALKYGSKKEFEEDMHRRFPFIDYMDVFFFDEDHLKLIGDIEPERKSELISKFFRLDRIDYFNSVAIGLQGELKKTVYKEQERYDNSKKLIDFIDQKMATLQLPGKTLDTLVAAKQRGMDLQKRYQDYTRFITENSQRSARLEMLRTELAKATGELEGYPALGALQVDLGNIDNDITDLRGQETTVKAGQNNYLRLKSELARVTKDGGDLYETYSKIQPDICPTCGQPMDSGKVEEYKASLWSKIEELLRRKAALEQEMATLGNAGSDLGRIQKALQELGVQRNQVQSQIQERQRLENTVTQAKSGIELLQRELETTQIPEPVELPENFLQIMASLESGIQAWNTYNSFMQDRAQAEAEGQAAKQALDNVASGIELFEKYIKLTSTTGKIYEEIMTKLSHEFSDNQVKYEVVTYNFRKKDHLDLASFYNKSGQWVSYQAASSGQKTVLDINFLSKIVTRLGLLVMDEFLKSLDPENHDVCIEMISGMNVGCIMLSSHMESITAFNNKTLKLSLNGSGLTTVVME
jgi:DNA repair exonuclease SbcCD ATPase subunit/DNA repair exonuclease SbcCD nuclease subunit